MLVTNAPARPRDFHCQIDFVLTHVPLTRPRRVVLDAATRVRFELAASPAVFEDRGQEGDFLVRLRRRAELRAFVEVAVDVLRFDGGRRHLPEDLDQALRLDAVLVKGGLSLAALVGVRQAILPFEVPRDERLDRAGFDRVAVERLRALDRLLADLGERFLVVSRRRQAKRPAAVRQLVAEADLVFPVVGVEPEG
ncbi:hypothetical protein KDW80_29625 [Burkholderia vietnamiensis]|nr:hypothetical protein [Burkholderia vietnamiensis]